MKIRIREFDIAARVAKIRYIVHDTKGNVETFVFSIYDNDYKDEMDAISKLWRTCTFVDYFEQGDDGFLNVHCTRHLDRFEVFKCSSGDYGLVDNYEQRTVAYFDTEDEAKKEKGFMEFEYKDFSK